MGLIPGLGTYPGFVSDCWSGHLQEATDGCFSPRLLCLKPGNKHILMGALKKEKETVGGGGGGRGGRKEGGKEGRKEGRKEAS